MTYRTGRHNGRIIYLQLGTKPADTDPMVGSMDSPELARAVVDALNEAEAAGRINTTYEAP